MYMQYIYTYNSVVALFNGALAAMCMEEAQIRDAQHLAESAWSRMRDGESDQARVETETRKKCLRLRDALAQPSGSDLYHDYLNAVRAASMPALWCQERLTRKTTKPLIPTPTPTATHTIHADPHAFPTTALNHTSHDAHELSRDVCAPATLSSLGAHRVIKSRPTSSTGWRTRPVSSGSAPRRPTSAAARVLEDRVDREREEAAVWVQLREAAATVAVDRSGRPGRQIACGAREGAEDAGRGGGSAADVSVSVAREKSVSLLKSLRKGSGRADDAVAWGVLGGGERTRLQKEQEEDACRRHLRSQWLVHMPVVACHVSPAVEEFLRAAECLFDADEIATCLAHLERLVEGVDTFARMCTNTHTHACTQTYTQPHTHTHSLLHTHAQNSGLSHFERCVLYLHALECAHTHTHISACKHAHTHTRPRTD